MFVKLVIVGLSAMSPSTATAELEACTGDVIAVLDGAPVGCDVQRPQRLDVMMLDGSTDGCFDMGGTPVGVPAGYDHVIVLCQGVDY